MAYTRPVTFTSPSARIRQTAGARTAGITKQRSAPQSRLARPHLVIHRKPTRFKDRLLVLTSPRKPRKAIVTHYRHLRYTTVRPAVGSRLNTRVIHRPPLFGRVSPMTPFGLGRP